MDKLDILIEKMAERMAEKAKVEEKVAEDDVRVKALEDKIAKLEKVSLAPEGLKGSGIEVGTPDMYKGFNFKKQGTDAPELMPKDAKDRDRVVKEVIDVFAKYSKNPTIQKATMTTITPDTGAEYVPEYWFSQVIEKARLTSIALQEARRFPMAGNTLHIPKQGTSITITDANEGVASSQSEPGSDDMTLAARRFGLWGTVNQELLDDAMIDIVSYITRDAVEALGQKIDDEVFNGTSVAFTGIFDDSTAVVVMGATNDSTSYTSITSRNFQDVIYKLTSLARRGAKFYLPREIMPYIMDLKYGASDSPLMTFNPSTIVGFPHVEVEAINGTNAANTKYIVFGNLQNYALGVRSLSESIEVNPYDGTSFKNYQVLFRFYVRMAGSPIFAEKFIKLATAA